MSGETACVFSAGETQVALAHQQFYHSGILCFQKSWQQFIGQLQYGAD